jgi:hypothetical protein
MNPIPVLVQTQSANDAQHVNVVVHVSAQVLAPDVARRKASGWLIDYVGNLLHAEQPQLLLGEQLAWQFQVALTSPRRGTVGYIGLLQMDAVTGEVLAPEITTESLHRYASQLTQRSALPTA